MQTQSSLQVVPLNPADNPCDLKGAFVLSRYWDDAQFRQQTFTGQIIDVRDSFEGMKVLFVPDEGQRNLPVNMVPKWVCLHYVQGWIYYGAAITELDPQTAKATAV